MRSNRLIDWLVKIDGDIFPCFNVVREMIFNKSHTAVSGTPHETVVLLAGSTGRTEQVQCRAGTPGHTCRVLAGFQSCAPLEGRCVSAVLSHFQHQCSPCKNTGSLWQSPGQRFVLQSAWLSTEGLYCDGIVFPELL